MDKSGGRNFVVLGLWFLFWLVLFTLGAGVLVIFISFFNPDSPLLQKIARCWGRILLGIARVPVQVEGLEHLRPGQAYVYAANHRSNFDIFVLISTLPGRFLFVAKKSLFKIPVFGQALSAIGSVSVDRNDLQSAIQSLNRAAAIVKSGISMIIFPEGTRATSRELLPFKKGVFIMALKAGQPIVPVSISGTRCIQPRKSLRVKPGPIRLVISPPIAPDAFRRKEDLMAAVRQAIDAHYDPDFPHGSGNLEP
jgi:1-acyl-sn-glycerol-3-phosphate acyltransferase